MLKAAEIAAKTSSKQRIINLLEVPGGSVSQQVMLQVRFAEVNRQALRELGVSLISGVNDKSDWIGRVTTQQFSSLSFNDNAVITFSDLLNLFVFNTKYNFGAVIRALQSRGYLQSLAEPNLIAYNGQEASFLAGGEVPIPIAQGGASAGAVGVSYKEFGIRLNFTPTIAGDVIRLKVRPEVSTLDFANGVTAGGIRIPALQTRRAETDVELRDGQSFAIAGLLDNISQETRQQVPWLGSLPIIGHLFRSRADNQQRTELMVLITPHLVRPLDPDEVPPLPTDPTRFYRPTEGAGGQLQGPGGTVDGPPLTTEGVAAPKPAPPAVPKKKGQK
jgi:pilus assembly protein CpaC